MKTYYLIFSFSIIFLIDSSLIAQSIWSGPMIEFEKEDNADPTNAINQDSISPSVAITRGNEGEIYNAFLENEAEKGISPLGTEWAVGNLSEIESLTFSSFRTAVVKPKFSVGQKLVLHVITENIYLSVEFTSWTQGKSGGGFKYKRSTDATTSIVENNSETKLSLFPNPSTNFIQITGLNQTENYEICDVVGSKIKQGFVTNNEKIDVTKLTKGFYFIKFEFGKSVRFCKK
ncbi:MAG: hypothetical protein CMD20_03595 [Flavobacteriales bacterium]|nr:hypothetical protein [Flavobacteriales bacterium]